MRVSTACAPDDAACARWDRLFRRAVLAVLAIAAFNLFFRLDREIVTEWDESLYAISAAETANHGNWLATTFEGRLDYYNTKPPLNIWLIALAYKVFGINLLSLRLASALAACVTVLVLMLWARRAFGAATAICAGLVLSCTYGFIYVHSGRSANTDALFTLLVLLTVVALWSARDRPWHLASVGAICAAVFLLRGMAVLMPLTIAAAVIVFGRRGLRERVLPLVAALVLFLIPVGAWAFLRWRFDGWAFLGRLFAYDFLARSATPLEGHTGSLLYYPNVLQKDHYEWLLAAAAAIWLFPVTRDRLRCLWHELEGDRYRQATMTAWLATTVVIPTLMQTKVAWYLNPFYPLFALIVGRIFAQGFSSAYPLRIAARRRVLAGVVLLALAVAESKLLFYSYQRRNLDYTVQGLLLQERERLAGRQVFMERWNNADRFVLEHIVGASGREAPTVTRFIREAHRGDFIVRPHPDRDTPELVAVRRNRRHRLCRRATDVSRVSPNAAPRRSVASPPPI